MMKGRTTRGRKSGAVVVWTWVMVQLKGRGAWASHADMFACRSKGSCPVVELDDSNYEQKTSSEPYFVMFYAEWCGHCKSLAPKLKKAAKEVEKFGGVKVGAVNVEANRAVQSKYPDIRGFPTLKFVSGKKTEDYNGPREADDIGKWTLEMAKKWGTLVEPVASKPLKELYTFFGRAGLDSKAAMLLVGTDEKAPEWFSTLHGSLKAPGQKKDAEAVSKLEEALSVAETAATKESIKTVLNDIKDREKSSSKPKYASAYTSDASDAFLPGLYVAFPDRKHLQSSILCFQPLPEKDPMVKKKSAQDFLHKWADTVQRSSCGSGDSIPFPDLPKPASVLAAEERAAKKKAKATSVSTISTPADLQKCYTTDRTCALFLATSSGMDPIAAKYGREGFDFAALESSTAPADLARALNNGQDPSEPTLVIVKGGRRPRAARATGLDNFSTLLDDVLAGGAKFDKFKDGLPAWDVGSEGGLSSDDL